VRRRKKLVRVHFVGNETSSVEGVFVGYWSGHYVLRVPKVLESAEASYALDGDDVTIPRERVLFMQRLSS